MTSATTYAAIMGQTIKKLRENKELKQGEMADEMGVSQAAWSKLESGKSVFSMVQVAKVAQVLNVTSSTIVQLADEAVKEIAAKGVHISYDSKEEINKSLMLIGAASIGAIVAAIIIKNK